ncbi:MAG TPA: 3'-5' exonuclease, partial [Dehalococcoidia bacterium]|nr:3'-5' exonuclease [Dehalococcoidia bacterium]
MNQTFVALDVETTGLDPSEDAITEVAAIRFHADGTELATFESLVDPGRPIPAFVESLTGISSGDVKGAPRIEDIGQKLLGFAGDDPVVGHNIEFDLQHLREAGFSLPGPPVDTATLSRVLLPT